MKSEPYISKHHEDAIMFKINYEAEQSCQKIKELDFKMRTYMALATMEIKIECLLLAHGWYSHFGGDFDSCINLAEHRFFHYKGSEPMNIYERAQKLKDYDKT